MIVTYTLLPMQSPLPFYINSSTGAISLNQSLDRENRSTYEFLVKAEDGGIPKGIGIASVYVQITDVNDNRPYFPESSVVINVSEYLTVDSEITTASAHDNDEGSNALMQYSISFGNKDNLFFINGSTGEIKLQSKLDFENKMVGTTFILHISVRDMGTPSLKGSNNFTLHINVLNIDDNQPVFEKSYYEASIPEDTSVNHTVLAVNATDKDMDTITYLIKSSNYSNWFEMQGNSIVVAKKLDYEEFKEVSFTVKATGTGSSSFTATAEVKIIVTDVNDNAPVFFPTSYSVNASETSTQGQLIAVVKATDNDSLSNSQLSFDLVSSGPFKIITDGNEGLIYLDSNINRESTASYHIIVNVSDMGSPKQWAAIPATVDLVIVDSNDNNPWFTSSKYFMYVFENTTTGSTVGQVNATDLDSYANGQITYSIGNLDALPFAINSSTGEITLTHRLRYKERSSYEITVFAKDGGMPARENRKSVVVIVVAQNLHTPEFNPLNYNVSIREGVHTGTFLIQVFVSDNDTIDTNLNYSITYGNTGNNFRIENDGKIYINKLIDREMTPFFNFSVSVSDSGTPSRTATYPAEILVYILDMNDNSPSFLNGSYRAEITERSTVGTLVTTVTAIDPDLDSNGQITYSFLDSNTSNLFSLNSQNGQINVTTQINYSQYQSITFYVVASDQGTPSRSQSVKVVVTILDVNEMPYFSPQNYNINITEALLVDSPIIKITALDKDSPKNADITYSITNGNSDNIFKIDKSGVIFLSEPIDVDPYGTKLYSLTISAVDSGSIPLNSSSPATVNVTILNVNQHQPIFTLSSYEYTLMENETTGMLGMPVNATDKDGDQVIYSMVNSTDAAYVTINNITGQISFIKNVDFESIQVLPFMIRATDLTSPMLFSDAWVVIHITDSNDNRPKFTSHNYSATINRDKLVGTIVTKLEATDKDSGSNGLIQYQFVNASLNLPFEIVDDTIRIKSPLTNELRDSFVVYVVASDQGNPPLHSDIAAISIQILPNTTIPRFEKMIYNVTILDNVTAGMLITRVHALDPDQGIYSQIKYELLPNRDGDENLFTVNSTTGEIRRSGIGVLDFANKHQHVLTVKASDGSGYYDKTAVYITIEDINDKNPVFQTTRYEVAIPENTPIGTMLIQVNAMDSDTGVGGIIVYKIASGNINLNFNVTNDGTLLLAKQLSPDEPRNFTLVIVAHDSASPPRYLSNNVTVIIEILLCLDYTPKFNQTEYFSSVTENTLAGPILNVFANFQSNRIGGTIRYFIVNDKYNSVFAINDSTGVISTLKSLDREQNGSYTFMVGTTNTLPNSQADHAFVTVSILDTNDMHPRFLVNSMSIDVSESEGTGTLVTMVTAIDEDLGENAKLNYSIVHGNIGQLFSINNKGEVFISKALHYENASVYHLVVNASDNGTPSLMTPTSLVLQINIIDINDHSPRFNQSLYTVTTSESTSLNVPLLTIHASDADGSSLHYTILDISVRSIFAINSSTGAISALTPLDFETRKSHRFPVEVSDGGMLRRKDIAMVEISVTDTNDNKPNITMGTYFIRVSESAPIGITVLTVKATDTDSGNNSKLYFDIVDGNFGNAFNISASDGVVIVANNLNYESMESYNLTIRVQDLGSPPSYADDNITVNIEVINENDNFPIFSQSEYNKTQLESSSNIASILEVVATDDDNLTPLIYSLIIDPELKSVFSIDSSTGILSAPNGLDYDTSPTKSYQFAVLASDGDKKPLSSTAFVQITLTDINDNYPVFSAKESTVRLSNNLLPNTVFFRVSATDLDSGNYSKITYSLDSVTPGLTSFAVYPSSGNIYFTGNLTSNVTYVLMINATDGGGNSATAKVNVIVEDTNTSTLVFPAAVNQTTPTTIEVALNIGDYITEFKDMTQYDIIAQEYHPDDPDCKYIFIC